MKFRDYLSAVKSKIQRPKVHIGNAEGTATTAGRQSRNVAINRASHDEIVPTAVATPDSKRSAEGQESGIRPYASQPFALATRLVGCNRECEICGDRGDDLFLATNITPFCAHPTPSIHISCLKRYYRQQQTRDLR